MSNQGQKPLCEHCGQVVENFLHQMEVHNERVVCPSCGNPQGDGKQAANAAESTPVDGPASSRYPRQN